MMKKIVAMLLLLSMLLSLAACSNGSEKVTESDSNGTEGTETEIPSGPVVSEDPDAYLVKYADCEAAENWKRENITESDVPPVNFSIDKKNSNELTWKKDVGQTVREIDYPNTDKPVYRDHYTVTYTCDEYGLSVVMEVTSYPQYPVVEYEAYLVNTASDTSKEVKNLYSINTMILDTKDNVKLNYYSGAASLSADDNKDYIEYTKNFKASTKTKLKLEVTNGKPTSTYIPAFNASKFDESGGVIALLSWQGNWKSEFIHSDSDGFTMKAGQNETRFSLLKGESHRFPAVVLIYYNGESIYGQNIYRKWWYNHNFLRQEGEHLDRSVLLATSSSGSDLIDVQSKAEFDLDALQQCKDYNIAKLGTTYVQDAGWYDYGTAENWSLSVGNWYPDPVRYPDGLKVVSDKAHEMGLGFMLWLEPERACSGTKVAADIGDKLIYIRNKGNKIEYYVPHSINKQNGAYGMVNLGDPESLEYIINTVDTVITEQGVDVYRQDFNYFPADYWSAYDEYQKTELGIYRIGRTEEQYCNGYLTLLDTLIERHPGLLIDACASGGMRYDLATARRAFMHTLTDFYNVSAAKAQSDNYVASLWYPFFGRGVAGGSDYDMYSSLALDTCLGIYAGVGRSGSEKKSFAEQVSHKLLIWNQYCKYMTDEFYPLTSYEDRNGTAIMAFQYHNSEENSGFVIAYTRPKPDGKRTEGTYYLKQIEDGANYMVYSPDDISNKQLKTGKEIKEEGLYISGYREPVVKVLVYEKLEKRS